MGTHEVLEEICVGMNEIEQLLTKMEQEQNQASLKECRLLLESHKQITQKLDHMEALMESMTLLLKKITELLQD